MELLESQTKLVDSIILSLQNYQAKVKTEFIDNFTQEVIDAINEKEIFGRNEKPHIKHIENRLDLIGTLCEDQSEMLKVKHLQTLWECLIGGNKIHFDHQHMYKFMRRICDAVIKEKVPLIDEELLIKFCSERIEQDTNFVSLTMDGYHFFQTFFCMINQKAGKLIVLGEEKVKMTSYNNVTGP